MATITSVRLENLNEKVRMEEVQELLLATAKTNPTELLQIQRALDCNPQDQCIQTILRNVIHFRKEQLKILYPQFEHSRKKRTFQQAILSIWRPIKNRFFGSQEQKPKEIQKLYLSNTNQQPSCQSDNFDPKSCGQLLEQKQQTKSLMLQMKSKNEDA